MAAARTGKLQESDVLRIKAFLAEDFMPILRDVPGSHAADAVQQQLQESQSAQQARIAEQERARVDVPKALQELKEYLSRLGASSRVNPLGQPAKSRTATETKTRVPLSCSENSRFGYDTSRTSEVTSYSIPLDKERDDPKTTEPYFFNPEVTGNSSEYRVLAGSEVTFKATGEHVAEYGRSWEFKTHS